MNINAFIKDVKYIRTHFSYMLVGLTPDGNVIKFFMNDDRKTNSSIDASSLKNKNIEFVGTVKKQEVNSHSQCMETMFGRVKIK